MKMNKKLILAMGLVGLTTSVYAAETVDIDASVVVANAFDLSSSASLDFGTISAFADLSGTAASPATTVASLVIPANTATPPSTSSTDDTKAKIISIVDGSPATLEVTGAAPNTPLQVTHLASYTVTNVDPSITDTFTLNAISTYATLTGGSAFGTNGTTTGKTFTTDGDGNLTFNLGGTLNTTVPVDTGRGALAPYGDGTYQATLTITVDY